MMAEQKILSVLKKPCVSEKTTNQTEKYHTIVFKVALWATKHDIAMAVETLLEVKVDSVRTVIMKGKTKRRGNKMTRRSDWKKAYITLQEGQNMDFLKGVE